MRAISITVREPTILRTKNKKPHQDTLAANSHVYAGEFEKGYPHGEGQYTFPNGDIYDGFFTSGTFNGKGTYTHANGVNYHGSFKNGKASGFGFLDFAENNNFCDSYEGEILDGFATGKGKSVLAFGDYYEGNFVDGKFSGLGSIFYLNGDVYEGKYLNGAPVGQGKMLFKEAKILMQRWFNGNGVDRQSTSELWKGTFEIKKKKKLEVSQVNRVELSNTHNNDGIMDSVFADLGLKISGKKRIRKPRKVKARKAKKVLKKTKKAKKLALIVKVKKRRRKRAVKVPKYDNSYLKTHRTNFCGFSWDRRPQIDSENFAGIICEEDSQSSGEEGIRRSTTMEITINNAESWFKRSSAFN